MSEVKVNVTSADGDIVIREGEALPLRHPEKIKISGNLKAVSSFLKNRTGNFSGHGLQKFNAATAIAKVNYEKGTVVLELDPNDPFGTVIQSNLMLDPNFEAFHINKNKLWSRVELVQFLKFQRRWFADPIKYQELLAAYLKLQVEVKANINQQHDDRGNRDYQLQKAVKSQNIPEKFLLTMPVFKGLESKSFWVDICLDTSDSDVKFWFESVEVAELIEIETKLLLDDEVKACEGIPVIVL